MNNPQLPLHVFTNLARVLSIIAIASPLSPAWAISESPSEARALRTRVEMFTTLPPLVFGINVPEVEYLLPLSRGFDQTGTEICWATGVMSAIETLARVVDPDSRLELSRRVAQRQAVERRFEDWVGGGSDYIGERGASIDAIELFRERGLARFADSADIVPSMDYVALKERVAVRTTSVARLATARAGLDRALGVARADRKLGRSLTRDMWQSWAPSASGRDEGVRHHPDADARASTSSRYVGRPEIIARIRDSLAASRPVVFSNPGHVTLIYGARYDAAGNPLYYSIKDSYPRDEGSGPLTYVYRADPQTLHEELFEVTTVTTSAPTPIR